VIFDQHARGRRGFHAVTGECSNCGIRWALSDGQMVREERN
jgi:hypothetical protein